MILLRYINNHTEYQPNQIVKCFESLKMKLLLKRCKTATSDLLI